MQMATQHAQAINRTIDKASTELSRRLSQATFPSNKFRDPRVDVPDLRFAQQEPAWARKLNGIQPAGPSPPAPPALVPKLMVPRLGLADESDLLTRPRLKNANPPRAQITMLNGNAMHLRSIDPCALASHADDPVQQVGFGIVKSESFLV